MIIFHSTSYEVLADLQDPDYEKSIKTVEDYHRNVLATSTKKTSMATSTRSKPSTTKGKQDYNYIGHGRYNYSKGKGQHARSRPHVRTSNSAIVRTKGRTHNSTT
eukprot:3502721-Amphidinium_carterae.1